MTTSEQARADAMADAETLRLNCRKAWDAGYIGRQAVDALKGLVPCVPSWPRRRAVQAACAAFRAVPGLRGEDTSSKVQA